VKKQAVPFQMLCKKPEKGQWGIGAKAQSRPSGNCKSRKMIAENGLPALLDCGRMKFFNNVRSRSFTNNENM